MPEDPGLPTGLLPPHIEEWLATMTSLTSVPPAMVTIPFLAAAGGVIGNRLTLQLHAGWTEYTTLWVALVALTGTRKTPALGTARLPFDLLHDELQAASGSSSPAVPLITPHATWKHLQQTLEPALGLILYRNLPRSLPPVETILDTLRAIHRHHGSVVTLSPAAEALWCVWHDAHLKLTYPSPWVIGGFYPKYPSQLARLALVLHAFWRPDDPSQPLDRDTMDRAITLIEYLRIHLHRSIFFINERHPVLAPVELLTGRIRETLASDHPHWIAHYRLACHLGRPPSAMLNTALDMLASQGEIESRIRKPEGGGRPARQYRLLPPFDFRANSR